MSNIRQLVLLPTAKFEYESRDNTTTLASGTEFRQQPTIKRATAASTISLSAFYGLRAANKNIEIQILNFLNDKQTLLLNVFEAYKGAVVNYEIYYTQKAQIKYLDNVYSQEMQKMDAGASTQTNVAQAKANLDKATANSIKSRMNIIMNLNTLKALTGARYKSLPKLPEHFDAPEQLQLKPLRFYQEEGFKNNGFKTIKKRR